MVKTKTKIHNYFKDLQFTESTHTYKVKGKKLKYSVSGLIDKFKNPFDKENIASFVAKKEGKTKEEILKEWQDKADNACDLGTRVHKFGELYPFDTSLKPKDGYERAVVNFWDSLPDFVIPFIMELEMYHKDYMFAGTGDILLYNTLTDTFIIGDYKTNEDLFKNFKSQKLKKPFHKLLDCNFNKYQLQLSFYQILLEQTGCKVSSRKIVWLLPDGNFKLYDTEDFTEELKEELKKGIHESR
jgi:hypothetical protein